VLISNLFITVFAFADNTVILAPYHNTMRVLLKICDCCGEDYIIKFNDKKTKCIFRLLDRMLD
jgi:hypothetical protein